MILIMIVVIIRNYVIILRHTLDYSMICNYDNATNDNERLRTRLAARRRDAGGTVGSRDVNSKHIALRDFPETMMYFPDILSQGIP